MVTNAQRRKRNELILLTAFLLVLLVVGTVFYHMHEKFTLVDSLYLTSVTLTTVGYGDVAPHTDAGKLFTSIYSFIGIGTFLAFAGAFFSAALARVNNGK